MTRGPRVVAFGGGHGTAVTLRAMRRYASDITAVVSVADDGGSSGRLREVLGVPALGDIRKCLVALADEGSDLAGPMEPRFDEGEMRGHALGNLLLAGLIESEGGLVPGVRAAGRLLGVSGRVLPSTIQPVRLCATGPQGTTFGQAEIARRGMVEMLTLDPPDVSPPDEVLAAIARAYQIVIGPGSLFTSVIASLLANEIRSALASSTAQTVYICNLRPQEPETSGYTVSDHLDALDRHGIEVDLVVWDSAAGMTLGDPRFPVSDKMLAGSNRLVHDPIRLADVLDELVKSQEA